MDITNAVILGVITLLNFVCVWLCMRYAELAQDACKECRHLSQTTDGEIDDTA